MCAGATHPSARAFGVRERCRERCPICFSKFPGGVRRFSGGCHNACQVPQTHSTLLLPVLVSKRYPAQGIPAQSDPRAAHPRWERAGQEHGQRWRTPNAWLSGTWHASCPPPGKLPRPSGRFRDRARAARADSEGTYPGARPHLIFKSQCGEVLVNTLPLHTCET